MAKPPRARRKINPIAKLEMGKPRVCVECDEEKEVSEANFATHLKGLRGWHRTCRVCQGVAAAEKGEKLVKKPRRAGTKVAYEQWEARVAEMYICAENPRRQDEAANIGDELRMAILAETDKRKSFMLFVEVVKPLIAGWKTPGAIHDDIIDGLISRHRRRLIIATRYSAKSTLTGLYVCWRIMNDPLIKVMIISRGSKLATRMLRVIRKVLIQHCPMLQHLMPDDDCLDNAEQFQTPQAAGIATGGATLSSFGISSDLPGYRSDLTIGDDVEGPSDDTPEKVMELEETLNELHMINPVGEKIMLGTYQTEYSVYARLADKEDQEGVPVWELHRACMFEEDPDDKKIITSRWLGMFSDKDAVDWRRSVTSRAWRLHALLVADPNVLNERPLKISDLLLLQHPPKSIKIPGSVQRTNVVANEVPRWAAPKGDNWYYGEAVGTEETYALTVAAIDPASGLAGRDAIGVAVVGVTLGGQAVIRHLEGVRGATKAANMRRCAEILKAFQVEVLVVEETKEGFFGETLENEMILVDYPLSVEKVTTGGQQKGRRIVETLAPPMGDGRIVMLEAVAYSDHGGEFVTQMTRISYDGRMGKSKDHDDIVDALAHAIFRVKGSLISDRADNMAEMSQHRMERLLEIPLKLGGLGGNAQYDDTMGVTIGRQYDRMTGDASLGELMVEEDDVLIRMVTLRDRLMESVREDQRLARNPDPGMLRRIRAMGEQIKTLKEVQVV
jgi:hypothetical protein